MNSLVLPLLSAVVAGCLHALEVDHMAAVTTFVSRRPHPLRAFGFGVRWGLGHSAAILLAGGLLVALGLRPPEAAVNLLEGAVGVMLVGLGVWVLVGVRRARAGRPAEDGRHGHGTTWVGAAHGLAGTGGFLALVPATLLASPWMAGAYLALFGVGTVLAMGVYAASAGYIFDRVGKDAPRLAPALRVAAGIASIGVGVAWLSNAF